LKLRCRLLLLCALPLVASCDSWGTAGRTTLQCTGEPQYRQCTKEDDCRPYVDTARKLITHVIDPARHTVDGMPAEITDSVATWEWEHAGTHYRISIDRFTRVKSMKVTTSGSWSELVARCEVARRSF